MACWTCVEKLTRKLLSHNSRLDLIRAFELAERGVERWYANHPAGNPIWESEEFKPKQNKDNWVSHGATPEELAAGDPYDYTQPCNLTVGSTGLCTSSGVTCATIANCPNTNTDCTHAGTGCPVPSKANSHYDSDTCVWTAKLFCNACIGVTHKCSSSYQCQNPTGECRYACDTGYAWNAGTQTCDLIATSKIELPKRGTGL